MMLSDAKIKNKDLDVPIHPFPYPFPFYGFQKVTVFLSAKIKNRLLCICSFYLTSLTSPSEGIAFILQKGHCFLQISVGPPRYHTDIKSRLNKYLELLLPVLNCFQMQQPGDMEPQQATFKLLLKSIGTYLCTP